MGRLLWAAAGRLRNCCALLSASLTGSLLVLAAHPWVGLAVASGGAMAYGVLIFRDLFDPKLICQVHGIDESAPQLGEGTDAASDQPLAFEVAVNVIEPLEHRMLFGAIIRAHEAIRVHLESANPMIRKTLVDTYRRCTEMARVAEPLVLRGQTLSQYLSHYRPESLGAEARAFERLAEESCDDRARAVFVAAAEVKRGHLATYRQVQGLCHRIRAHLALIKVSLESVEARLVKLVACDADAEQSARATVEELSDVLWVEIGSLESGIEAVEGAL